jgi:hypothetical protein
MRKVTILMKEVVENGFLRVVMFAPIVMIKKSRLFFYLQDFFDDANRTVGS